MSESHYRSALFATTTRPLDLRPLWLQLWRDYRKMAFDIALIYGIPSPAGPIRGAAALEDTSNILYLVRDKTGIATGHCLADQLRCRA